MDFERTLHTTFAPMESMFTNPAFPLSSIERTKFNIDWIQYLQNMYNIYLIGILFNCNDKFIFNYLIGSVIVSLKNQIFNNWICMTKYTFMDLFALSFILW